MKKIDSITWETDNGSWVQDNGGWYIIGQKGSKDAVAMAGTLDDAEAIANNM